MKKINILSILLLASILTFGQEIVMPTLTNVEGVNNHYSLIAVIVSVLAPFILILIKILIDNRKHKNLTEYITIHDKKHQLDEHRLDNIERSINELTKISEKTSKILTNQQKSINAIKKKVDKK